MPAQLPKKDLLGSAVLPTERMNALHRQQMKPFTSFVGGGPDKIPPVLMTVQRAVAELREGGIPISAIANAMNVERKTIYSWIDGKGVQSSHRHRVLQVHSLLTAIENVDVRNIYRYWITPIDGQTLRDLLCAETIDVNRAKLFLSAIRPAAIHAKNLEERMSRNGLNNPILDDLPEAGVSP